MSTPHFLQKEIQNILVTYNCPGVFCWVNFGEKKAWLSYSENVSEAIIRNIKLVGSGQHKIKSLDGWELWVEPAPNKTEAKKFFMFQCTTYQIKSYTLLNKLLKNTVTGKIAEDFRGNGGFLYYVHYGVWGVIAIFEKASDGEHYLKDFSPAEPPKLSEAPQKLLNEFKKANPDAHEYRKMFE